MKKTLWVGFLFLFLIFMNGCGAAEDQLKSSVKPKSTEAATPTRGDSSKTITLTGKVEAVQSANLVSKIAGKVETVSVDIGSTVKAGQVLITLSAEDKAADIEVSKAALQTAQVAYDLALSNYERGKELYDSQAIAQADFENNYEGNLKKAEAGMASAQANLKRAQVSYNDMLIKAPFNGIITARNINPGELAGTQTTLLSLVNLNQVVIRASITEEQINRIKAGQEVQVKVTAVSEKPLTGKIANIALAADPQTKAYPVKIQVDNTDHILKPGMFAEVTVK
ncbi:efflux RND transporter periplasmic adaptor subunit [Desulforamulus ruminis]|uniref:Secretion protein HlyD family protein n=1 Tax=Desulforamulus ruminis (strain ATCC 23193 / DSM 2154 / NCIMB 8452 / DL) TaxID=696281 RepID=F6DLL8_DESRL|nr:efflux RND transporter periplasmic adaptor subunit [Desulforamulus ruminis]AEG61660.1 secretion protein HlyD family protein [Desulforamulus ruminis DSM 2154]